MILAILRERFVNTRFRLVNAVFHANSVRNPCWQYEKNEARFTMKNAVEFSSFRKQIMFDTIGFIFS